MIELRLDRARTTKDVDLRLVGSPDGVLRRFQEAGRLDLGDLIRALRAAIESTFEHRATHPVPVSFPEPSGAMGARLRPDRGERWTQVADAGGTHQCGPRVPRPGPRWLGGQVVGPANLGLDRHHARARHRGALNSSPRSGPPELRCPTEFLWWFNLCELQTCEEKPWRITQSQDFLMPCWMGRYCGFIPAEP